MRLSKSLTYSLFDPPYGSEFPIEQLYLQKYNVVPSTYEKLDKKYDTDIKNYFLGKNFKCINKVEKIGTKKHYENKYVFELDYSGERLFVSLFEGKDNNTNRYFCTLTFKYDLSLGEIHEQFQLDDLVPFEINNLWKSKISLVTSERGYVDTQEFNIKTPEVNVELNYGKPFLNVHNTILERLNTPNDSGIVLMHGLPGSGKTSYLRYLASLIKEKEIIFVTPAMSEALSEPSFVPFLMEHKNSILIIEDAEKVISDRQVNGSSVGVSNILNLTDGILGDCLSIQVIATFNMSREKIDSALLRKGRLIAEHKFDKLSVEDSNTLLTHLGKDVKTNEPLVLADIYNIEVDLHRVNNDKTKIGF